MTAFEIWTLIGGAGIVVGVCRLLFIFGKIANTIETIQSDISEIKLQIRSIDGRLNHLEGAFFERGQWEARTYKMAKDILE